MAYYVWIWNSILNSTNSTLNVESVHMGVVKCGCIVHCLYTIYIKCQTIVDMHNNIWCETQTIYGNPSNGAFTKLCGISIWV